MPPIPHRPYSQFAHKSSPALVPTTEISKDAENASLLGQILPNCDRVGVALYLDNRIPFKQPGMQRLRPRELRRPKRPIQPHSLYQSLWFPASGHEFLIHDSRSHGPAMSAFSQELISTIAVPGALRYPKLGQTWTRREITKGDLHRTR